MLGRNSLLAKDSQRKTLRWSRRVEPKRVVVSFWEVTVVVNSRDVRLIVGEREKRTVQGNSDAFRQDQAISADENGDLA